MNINNEDVLISFSTPEYKSEVDLRTTQEHNTQRNLNKRQKSFIVGYIQQMNLSQKRQITKLFEIGNKGYDMVASKVRTNLQINRVLLDGPSIMKYVAYALYPDVSFPNSLDEEDRTNTPDHFITNNPNDFYNEQYAALIERVADDMGFTDRLRGDATSASRYVDNSGWGGTPEHEIPGTADFWINLTSGLFEKPIGIFLDIRQKGADCRQYAYGGVFLENCMISSHNLSTQANSRILSENMMIEVGMPIPCIGYGGYDVARLEHKKQHERLSEKSHKDLDQFNDQGSILT